VSDFRAAPEGAETRVRAPGKLVLTGAYAVLAGAPAIVMAVDRYAVADASSTPADVRALHDETGRKLGLGSSAAATVAQLGARALAKGDDPRDPAVRDRLFRAARAEHARAQGGGSGVDVAASVYGGVLRYAIDGHEASIRATDLPRGLVYVSYWSGTSARTSELRARVDALRARGPHPVFDELHSAASEAAAAIDRSEAGGFVRAAREFGAALDALGRAADAPIVPPAFAELASFAAREDSCFLPSGAGGGDVGLWLGCSFPSAAFSERARACAMRSLALSVDRDGVKPDSPS